MSRSLSWSVWSSAAGILNCCGLFLVTLHDLSRLHSVVSFLSPIQDTGIRPGLPCRSTAAETLHWSRRLSRNREPCVCGEHSSWFETVAILRLMFVIVQGDANNYCYIKSYDWLVNNNVPCGGGLEYLRRSPAGRKRRQKANAVPESLTGPPCSGWI
jgi:hypothetical protein